MHPLFARLNYMGQLEKKLCDDIYGDYKFNVKKEVLGYIEEIKIAIQKEASEETQKKQEAMLKALEASVDVIDLVWARFNG